MTNVWFTRNWDHEQRNTWSRSLLSKALAMARAASTPRVFPSRRKALRPWYCSISRTSSSTENTENKLTGVRRKQGPALWLLKTKLNPLCCSGQHPTWLCIVQLQSQALIAQLSIPDMGLGESISQLCNIIWGHNDSVRNIQRRKNRKESDFSDLHSI